MFFHGTAAAGRTRRYLLGIPLVAVMCVLYAIYLLGPVSSDERREGIMIERGTGMEEIAVLLKERGIIRSRAGFRLYALFSGSAHRLKPGLYEFFPASTTPEVVGMLVAGPPTNLSIRIPEGVTLRDVDNILAVSRIIAAGSFENLPLDALMAEYAFLRGASTLEGFLFPDTYRFAVGSSPESVVRKILDNFVAQALPLIAKSDESAMRTLTVASLLEREVPGYEDRRLVAGVIERRLRNDMPLQIDATVLYFACERKFIGCPMLEDSDYRASSPYNTYAVRGLPPSPIVSPGLEAIRAALAPRSSRFLYYLSDPATQRTIFAETLSEHERNRAKYLRSSRPPHPPLDTRGRYRV